MCCVELLASHIGIIKCICLVIASALGDSVQQGGNRGRACQNNNTSHFVIREMIGVNSLVVVNWGCALVLVALICSLIDMSLAAIKLISSW